jgi:hypothetical protein
MDGVRSLDKGDDRLGQGLEVEPVPDMSGAAPAGNGAENFSAPAAGGAGKIARATVS